MSTPVALVTGAAQRLGARIARQLHQRGWRVIVHYRSRTQLATDLVAELNAGRADSALALHADLADATQIQPLADAACAHWRRLDGLINNASVFHPTPVASASLNDWDAIMHTNVRAPLLLTQACLPALKRHRGAIVNLIDIYAERPLPEHPIYSASKAALASLTRSWAQDLAPEVRANGVSPGAILWPDDATATTPDYQQAILAKTPLGRTGVPDDIAGAVAFLLCDAPFITGQILAVDGGRSLYI
ncbi:pteridine reductase [Marinobacter sp. X15-166B]|uniref:pteridine reductase n=1 Tax=Marinobacter sp. X15-166B TaxID=1897620 RepID=UPI00085CA51D|nr:pteridine reductase [Marinobacter sp. X15-166B]OEY65546.1 pteridine reductase [Marinobacter sp. X15-166B]